MNFKVYETSSAQKRLHSINHLQGSSILYNEIRVWTIKGHLEPGRLKEAVQKLAARHESLRTCFVMKDGEILQKVYDLCECDFKYSEMAVTEPVSVDIEGAVGDFVRPHDLQQAPLWRIELVQIGEDRQLLFLDFHHIICDGMSMDLVVGELTRLYLGMELPELEDQYVDFAIWQNDLFQDERIKKQEAYWLTVFGGEVPILDLPTDYPRSAGADIGGSNIEFQLEDSLTGKLRQLVLKHKTTLYVVLLAAYNILLSKYANQEDIVVGTPIAGRTHREFERIVGMFVNTLAMRNKPVYKKTFDGFLQEVSQNIFAAFENQDYQFEMLVEKVVPERRLNRNPLFDTMFALQNYTRSIDLTSRDKKELVIAPYRFKSRSAKFDLTLQAFEVDRHIEFRLEYRASLFRKETIERFTRHFINIFREVTENPGVLLSEIRMISLEEKDHLLYVLNGTSESYPLAKTIHELFERQAERIPGNFAVIAPGERLTYRELNEKANRLAHLLRKKGVRADTVVALLMERSLEMIIGVLGILKAGGAYLPIDPDYPENRIAAILEDSGVSYLLTRESVTRGIHGLSFTALQQLNADPAAPVLTNPRAPIRDFDTLPAPDRTLVNYEKYHQQIGIAMARHTVSLQATRGCPYNCAYCHKIWPKKHVVRSAENIYDEMSRIYDAGGKRFVFIDDIFNLDAKNSTRLLEKLTRKLPDVQLFFPNGLRGDILTKEFIDLMVEAGTANIDLALESASPRIQKMIGKNLNLEKFSENVRYITQRYPRLLLEMELMIGFPTETEEEALMTLDFLKELRWVHFPNLNILKIYPNTDMCRLALANGVGEQAIDSSVNLAYHELPDTLPFSRSFTR
ncbi:MAG: AMP-binding protein, partial [bacterium]|nr:AMP-binding protein [bacterium]